jgi:hypothetical protein
MRQLAFNKSLLLALCSATLIFPNFPAPSLAQPTVQPTLKPTVQPTPPQESNPKQQIQQKLLGQWEYKNTAENVALTFLFAPNGKFFILSQPDGKNQRQAVEIRYAMNSRPQPMQLDVYLPNQKQPVQTIFEFTADGKMRMQLEGTDPGKPRPKKFANDGSIFEKISDSTELPSGTVLLDGKSR